MSGTACTAEWCADEEWCGLTCAADVFARRYHPVIVAHLLADGPAGFSDLESGIERVSGTVLSESLDDLESKGVVDRRVVSERPYRVEYALTERGAALEPVVEAMADWGAEQVADSHPLDGTG